MTRDCWKDFAHSGKVSDYLQYRKQEGQSERLTGEFTSDSALDRAGQTLSGTVSEEKAGTWDRHSL